MKVGIIDSGKGGKNIEEYLTSNYNIEVFRYTPYNFQSYGNLSLSNLRHLCSLHIDYLESKQVECIIIGCMTLSTNCLSYINIKAKVPVYDLYSVLPTLNKSYTVFATSNSIRSTKFNKCQTVICKELASVIEKDYSSNLVKGLLKGYIAQYNYSNFNNIILGCSHYSLIIKEFYEVFNPKVLINPTELIIKQMSEIL